MLPAAPPADPKVFISYARSDGEAYATALRERLEAAGIPLWQDRVGEEGGRDWWLQITEALDKVEFMVLIMTPRAMQSEMVRKEWRYARQRGVCVYPVKAAPDLDFASLPRWIRDSHFYELGYNSARLDKGPEWRKFLADLNEHCEIPRVPFMAEDLPTDHVPRTGELNALLGILLDERREAPVAVTAALRGAGGYGKTALANAICHDEHIQQAFDDGVLWVTLGERPDNLIGRVIDLIEVLSGERPGFTGIDAASARLAELLADRDILMVIDDIWDSVHLKPFMQGGKRCARLITTRNTHVLPPDAHKVDVDAMRSDEAVKLLSDGLPITAPDMKALRKLASRLGEWALLLKLAKGVLRERVNNGQPLRDALAYVEKALDKRGLVAFDARNAEVRGMAVTKTLEISLELLRDDERARYFELAIFPEDIEIPLATLEKLWGATGGLDDFDTEELCNALFDLSLLLTFDPNTRHIRLHDIMRSYLRGKVQDQIPALHSRFLDAYDLDRWADLPIDEPYLWDHLAYHLAEAGLTDELIETVKDLRYLATKAHLRSVYATEGDLYTVWRTTLIIGAWWEMLKYGFANAAHILDRCVSLEETLSTLYCRLQNISPELSGPLKRLEQELPRPYLAPWHKLPDLPHPALSRTLSGHTSTILGCVYLAKLIISASEDKTLKVWDTHTGAEQLTLAGHKAAVNCCVVSPDGALIYSASEDDTLKVWDAQTGAERGTFTGHSGAVKGCALSPDGDYLVSASNDRTLRIWDTQTCAERQVLRGHTNSLNCCAVSPNGEFIVSGSSDRTLKVWDAKTGAERFTLAGHTGAILGCAVSPDSTFIVSSSADHKLKIWDAHTGTERRTLIGHKGLVNRCAIGSDGTLIVSASNDKTVKLWDVQSGAERATLAGHTAWVNACAISPSGDFVVSGAWDSTLKVWDVRSLDAQAAQSDHSSTVYGCAVSPDGDFVVSAAYDKTLKIWDAQTGQERITLTGHGGRVTNCLISASGELIVSSSYDRNLRLWDAKTGERRAILKGHGDRVLDCALSPDDDFIVSASLDKTLKIWDARTGKERLTLSGHGGPVICCAAAPDFVVSGSYDQTLRVWDARTGAERSRFVDRTGSIRNCAVDASGSVVVTSYNNGLLKVWDLQSGEVRLTLSRHNGDVRGCALSPAGDLIVSVCEDGTLKVWKMADGCCLTTLHVDGPLNACVFHPDGERIVAAGNRGVYFLRLVR